MPKSKSLTSPVGLVPVGLCRAVGAAPVPFAGCQSSFFLDVTFLFAACWGAASEKEEDYGDGGERTAEEEEEAALKPHCYFLECSDGFLWVHYCVTLLNCSVLDIQCIVREVPRDVLVFYGCISEAEGYSM